ncbi:MAG TPA: cell envelope integrity protein TolA [Steroidobacteraceae bacterium]|nr:cell envelope integrity protein TolA [Steroidobacteraceae bacterium]
MNPFLKEHAGPLLRSATLHLALAVAVVAAALWTVTPRVSPPAAIDAYVAKLPAPPAAPPPAPVPPAPATEPVPPPNLAADREREAAEAAARAHHDEELRLTAARAAEATLKAKADAERRATEQEAQRRAVEEAKRKADAVEAKRKSDAAEAKRKAEAQALAAQRAVQESDLAKQLAAEEHRLGAENSGLLARYVSDLQARIERAWNRPPTARAGLKCTVYVAQVPGGTVTNVRLGNCNGDAAVQQSITLAVYRASPLPAPPDPSLFERNLQLVFEPND